MLTFLQSKRLPSFRASAMFQPTIEVLARKPGLTFTVLLHLAALLIFVVDCYLPLGVAMGFFYVFPILGNLWVRRALAAKLLVTFCVFFVVAGYFLSPSEGAQWQVIFNRCTSVFTLLLVAILVEVVKQERFRLREESSIDALTGLSNFRSFTRKVKQELAGAKRYDRGVSLTIIDINNFKRINDELGHDVGNEFLKSVGELLRSITREEESIARIGGDEFSILAAMNAPERDLIGLESRFKQSLEGIVTPQFSNLNVGFSLGSAAFPSGAQNFEELFRRADVAMYESKRNSTNSLVLS